jgi:hypothetical protein
MKSRVAWLAVALSWAALLAHGAGVLPVRFAPTALAQGRRTVTFRDGEVHGRKAWILENGTIHVALLHDGGHIAEIQFLSDNPRLSINPMFIPAGNGYMGHMVCFPNFGPASAEERQNGIGGHGEANAVEWRQTRPPQVDDAPGGLTFFYGADLPKTGYRIERAVSLREGEAAVHIEEWIENLAGYDRPYNLDEHATFGAPFVAPLKTVLDISGTKGMTDPRRTAGNQWAAGREFAWPDAPKADGSSISLRDFRAVPMGQAYTAVAADASRPVSWFTIHNVEYPLLVGYLFPTADYPWIIDWQNQPQTDGPAGTARGIEFGTSPVDEGLRKSVERGQMFGVPTYRFIAAKQRLATTFTIFLAEIPVGFSGAQDVRAGPNGIVVTERGSRREFTIK